MPPAASLREMRRRRIPFFESCGCRLTTLRSFCLLQFFMCNRKSPGGRFSYNTRQHGFAKICGAERRKNVRLSRVTLPRKKRRVWEEVRILLLLLLLLLLLHTTTTYYYYLLLQLLQLLQLLLKRMGGPGPGRRSSAGPWGAADSHNS